MYTILKSVESIPHMHSRKTRERRTMEELEIGDAFVVDDEDAAQRARWARRNLEPKKFSIRKLTADGGWQIRREE